MSELSKLKLGYETLESEYKQIKVLRVLRHMRVRGFRRRKGDYERIYTTLCE